MADVSGFSPSTRVDLQKLAKSDGESTPPTPSACGRAAEQLAAHYLTSQGYQIIARNHYCRGGEVDLIAWHEGVLCFIEVRARTSDAFGHPLETIDARKVQRVVRASADFLQEELQHHWRGPMPPMRFDALGILLYDPPEFTLAQEAFTA